MIIERNTAGEAYANRVYLVSDINRVGQLSLDGPQLDYVRRKLEEKSTLVAVNRYGSWAFVATEEGSKEPSAWLEAWRRRGNELAAFLKKEKIAEVEVVSLTGEQDVVIAFAEGVALGSYEFSKYLTKNEGNSWALERLILEGDFVPDRAVRELAATVEVVSLVRDLVNEPVTWLNAEKLAETFVEMGQRAGFPVEVLGKQQIESLKMGGLLAVNKGSIDPPTFTIMEWKPANAKNSQPIVLVGKGIVFDTGGLSLKPTPSSMDYMKSDMAGGAAVAGTLYLAARIGLPVHLIALVPATDNRPDGNALTPGDIIRMHNGATVEVLNTDAEGRLILADALSFAGKYNPELVIDVATLTGSAAMALGIHGIAAMGTAGAAVMEQLKGAGDEVYERIVELPLWDEYDEMIKSDIADMKNIGSREAGAITAGKFLQRFTGYPWIHLDIAGPAFLQTADHYRSKGGSAAGVRLLIRFLENYSRTLPDRSI